VGRPAAACQLQRASAHDCLFFSQPHPSQQPNNTQPHHQTAAAAVADKSVSFQIDFLVDSAATCKDLKAKAATDIRKGYTDGVATWLGNKAAELGFSTTPFIVSTSITCSDPPKVKPPPPTLLKR